MKKRTGIVLLVLGIVCFSYGGWELYRARHPRQCVVDFARSLGAGYSMPLESSLRDTAFRGKTGLVLGGSLSFVGSLLLVRR